MHDGIRSAAFVPEADIRSGLRGFKMILSQSPKIVVLGKIIWVTIFQTDMSFRWRIKGEFLPLELHFIFFT